ncbi:hypothetical protein ElyMa_002045500 [Elysia marginata]|uniref:Uncharacterized protein n=1 Tax=Elysia marginata TaxID=1093978 RepID=A0AAV4F9A5_9GAST|nr:hypothetical protein ElyMa_002045500 [Elysia marginata]
MFANVSDIIEVFVMNLMQLSQKSVSFTCLIITIESAHVTEIVHCAIKWRTLLGVEVELNVCNRPVRSSFTQRHIDPHLVILRYRLRANSTTVFYVVVLKTQVI